MGYDYQAYLYQKGSVYRMCDLANRNRILCVGFSTLACDTTVRHSGRYNTSNTIIINATMQITRIIYSCPASGSVPAINRPMFRHPSLAHNQLKEVASDRLPEWAVLSRAYVRCR